MAKVLIISGCIECKFYSGPPSARRALYNLPHHCCYMTPVNLPRSLKETPVFEIPEWCPLPEVSQ